MCQNKMLIRHKYSSFSYLMNRPFEINVFREKDEDGSRFHCVDLVEVLFNQIMINCLTQTIASDQIELKKFGPLF